MRPLRRLAALLLAAALSLIAERATAGDPYLYWRTIQTPHFRVHFHGGLEHAARRTASLAESIHRRLVPQLGWAPGEVTHIVLTDVTDSANGSATALPYNTIRLFVSAPDDMSALGDYDDWLTELITHEHTHILHVDNVSGIPSLINAVFGKTLAPNQTQPRWILEGLAVAMESEHTSGGRLRSTLFDMYLRADVLDGRVATLDQISNPARRWPSGNLWYLYGGKFIEFIVGIYGPDTYAAVATDYGQNPIPWGINRSIRRATGSTYPQLYEAWLKHLNRKYAKQVASAKARGLRIGTQLTHRGRVASSPRFMPPQCRDQDDPREQIAYYRADGDTTAGLYLVPLESRSRADEDDAELVARSNGTTLSFDGCGIVFDTVAPSRRLHYLTDLFRQPAGTSSARGVEHTRQRLTVGRRARDPGVSPDGRRIVYVTNRAGTSTLRIAEIASDGSLHGERRLVPSARYEQAFTPRFSPTGKRVAYGVWTRGGYRDVRVVDVKSGRFIEIAHDRAVDQQPTFTPDGRYVLFSSDRTGISNIFAYELATRRLKQVTNVLTGAFMPEVAPDGRTLFYIGYTSYGFDLFSIPLEASRWLDAPPYVDTRPAPPPNAHLDASWHVETYNPLPTLRPHAYELEYGPGVFGNALSITTTGSDVVGLHAFAARMTVEPEIGEPTASLDYAYRRLPFSFSASVFHSAAPRQNYSVDGQNPVVTQRLTGGTTGVSYAIPGVFDGQRVSLSYTAAEFDTELPVASVASPFAPVPQEPFEGFLGLLHLGYSYSNTESYADSISEEKGFSLVLGLDYAAEEIASESTLTAFNGRFNGYVPMPWASHHVLAFAASGGSAIGTYPRRGFYFTGGFVDSGVSELVDAFTSGLRQSSFVLRGYEPAAFIGRQYNLLNAEYRFPIAYVDRGISTLPVFWRTLSGAVFADYGGAFNQLDPEDPFEQYHLGVGAEIWIDLVMGYFVGGNVRVGYARGFDEEAIEGGQLYTVVSSAF